MVYFINACIVILRFSFSLILRDLRKNINSRMLRISKNPIKKRIKSKGGKHGNSCNLIAYSMGELN